MLILGVESSCDETALALVENGRKVFASEIASSVAKQAIFGGVVPEIAAREHLKALVPLLHTLLKNSNKSLEEIDAIAVTRGPGLIGSLLVGVSFAKSLSLMISKPLIPVDHVHAHLHGALLGLEETSEELFPSIGLVVSGGHTNIYYMKNETTFEKLVSTIDDACGESFDKVGKTLGLPYPGGPHIERIAKSGDKSKYPMPTMVQEKSRLEFSYSGLKTHVLNTYRKVLNNIPEGDVSTLEAEKCHIAASFQEEALGQIARKIRSVEKLKTDAKSVIIAGGVAANIRFQKILADKVKKKVFFPKLKFCSDNAAMIAAYGYHVFEAEQDKNVFSIIDWDPYSRYGANLD